MIAYHGNAGLKERALARVEKHRQLDQIIQGIYWNEEEQKGCAVGCLLQDPDGGHKRYETEFGIPEQLAWLEDGIFEALPIERAKEWPGRFLAAIPVGADLAGVWPRFAIWLLTDPEWGIVNVAEAEDVKDVCRRVAAGYEQILAGGITDEDAQAITDTARAARAALAAWDAWVERAAWDAWAAWDARNAWAAWDAWAARAARAAWEAWAERDAWAERAEVVEASAEKLIELLATSPPMADGAGGSSASSTRTVASRTRGRRDAS